MTKLRTLTTIIAIGFGIGFLDGLMGIGFSDDLYLLVGIAMLVSILWLLVIVWKYEAIPPTK